MLKRVAALFGGIDYDSQKRLVSGVLKRAMNDEPDAFIFACDAWDYDTRYQYEMGEFAIYTLPDFSQYDAIIANFDTIHNLETVKKVIGKIEEAGKPCVSINKRIEGLNLVQMVNGQSIAEIIHHLVNVHEVKDFFYLSGPRYNMDAEKRFTAVAQALSEHDIDLDDSNILFGDYTFASGLNVGKQLVERDGKLPEAIVCANDWMATGVTLALKEAGYRVPEDVIVTGFDNAEVAKFSPTRLTTVKRHEEEAGSTAYDVAMKLAAGENCEHDYYIAGDPIFAASCGCNEDLGYDKKAIQDKLVMSTVKNERHVALIKRALADVSSVKNYSELVEVIKYYLQIVNPKMFYLMLCGNPETYTAEIEAIAEGREIARDVTKYTDTVVTALAYENGEFHEYGQCPTKYIIPEGAVRNEHGNFYFVTPLHYLENCFGYLVVGNTPDVYKDNFLYMFTTVINTGLANVYNQDIMNTMLGQLNRVWMQDELTGVFNRAGLKKYAPKIIEEACAKSLPLTVLFCDLDGLKKVNDNYGHEEGDFFIKAVASILEQLRKHGELLVRYGGDEFVLIAAGVDEETVKEYIGRLSNVLGIYNSMYDKPYKVDVSVGYHIEKEAWKVDLDMIIEMADKNMYIDKKRKKSERID